MLKNNFLLFKQSSKQFKHFVSIRTQASTRVIEPKWDIFTAVCLERKPVVTPEMNEIEKEYSQYTKEVEYERSVKSKFELRHEKEVKQLEILKKGGEVDDSELSLKQTAQDLKDLWVAEASSFKLASRITEADKKNDLKSMQRKLDKHLVFVVNQKIGNDKFYMLPQGIRKENETLRQTAERTLTEFAGKEIKAQIYSNAPCGFYKYKYPLKVREESNAVGAKIFIYFARYLKGELNQKGLDYRWLDRAELNKTLPPLYKNSVQQILIDE